MMSATEIIAASEAKKRTAEPVRNVVRHAEPDGGKVLAIDPSRLVGVVDPAEFDCESVYRVFHALTFEWRVQDRETTWFDLIGRIVPGKYQFRFTESDWRRVYAEFTGRSELLKEPELFERHGGLIEAALPCGQPHR